MSSLKSNMVLALAVAAAVVAPNVFATNGYFTEGEGTVNRGMAGAGIAMPQDALAAAINPAGIVKLGGRMDVGLGLFRPDRNYSITGNNCGPCGGGTLNGSGDGNDTNNFLIPSFGYNMPLSNTDAFNISVYGNGGMDTNYHNTIFGPFGSSGNTGVNLSQLFVNGAYAHSFGDLSVGGSAIIAYQRFAAFGLQGFKSDSSDPNNMTNNGFDTTTGFGVRLGALYDVNQDVSVGATYQSKIKGKFDKYKGLFAEQGEFDIPSTYGVGVAWKATPAVKVALDYTKINYTDSKSVSNPIENLTVNGKLFGASDGPGFGWKDISVVKLGVQYMASSDWTLRAGWDHGQNPIPSSQVAVNILAPGVVTDHLNLGFTKAVDKSSDVNFMFSHAFKKEVTGPVPTNFGGGTAKISLEENYAEVGYSKKF
ncbi:MAG: OmpP1/FadL family transporter [Sulfuricaulis sp.]